MQDVLILGGDGYLGWPTAMYLSSKGYNVTVVDNYFRRRACTELNIKTLYENINLIDRAKLWYQLTGHEIKVLIADLTDPQVFKNLFTNKTIYGGTNLCYWRNNLFIGFCHTRNPWYSVPILYDAENYTFISKTSVHKTK